MATIIEDGVKVIVSLQLNAEGQLEVLAHAQSTAGEEIIRNMRRDITADLTATQKTGAENLLNLVTSKVKTLWEIS